MPRSFDVLGPQTPESPVVLSVPHAGREYPAAIDALARVPRAMLASLEDRFVDAVALAAHGRETLIVQRRARAWIDLNRAEDDRDPRVDEGAGGVISARARGGLGLVPRRSARGVDLWRRRLRDGEVVARIAEDHRPFHAAVAQALQAARARFGIAVLIDVHSMPSLGAGRARIVLGDRFGRSADARFAQALGYAGGGAPTVALNAPYAGGHVVERHGEPAQAIHAIQVEFDRALYLDAALDRPGVGLDATAAVLRAMVAAAVAEAQAGAQGAAMPIAAE